MPIAAYGSGGEKAATRSCRQTDAHITRNLFSAGRGLPHMQRLA
jgi:hypothetical protein